MSRQSKQAKNKKRDAEFSALRKSGGHGPERTTPKHGKTETRNDPGSKLFKQTGERLGKIVERMRAGKSFSDVQGG